MFLIFRRRRAGLSFLLAAAAFATADARAAETIGVAAVARNEVNGVLPSRSFRISAGQSVFRSEIVKTGQDSSAKLVFVDSTNLAIGPKSMVSLDKFVFSGASTYNKAAVNLAKGAFRFTSGRSDKRAYEINTPVATLAVRGTILEILSQAYRTFVRLVQGGVRACTRTKPRRCTVLTIPGETAIIDTNSATNAGQGGAGDWSFASVCASNAALCETTDYSSLGQQDGAVDADTDNASLDGDGGAYLMGGAAAAAAGAGAGAAAASGPHGNQTNSLSLPVSGW